MIPRSSLKTALLLALLGPVACSHQGRTTTLVVPAPAPSTAASATLPPAPPQTTVLMLNGGGSAATNYQSHLVQLRELRELLMRGGIDASRISILASDGADPAPDLATRAAERDADLFRVDGTSLEPALTPPITTVDSRIEGATLGVASKQNVVTWFQTAAKTLHAGDTLLFYVTDHGTRVNDDPLDNRISLWKNEWISAREVAALVMALPRGVRVVSLMSQCFSGGFASLAFARAEGDEPSGESCGYFSSTSDRPAYGCFPENRGKDNVGHSFEFTRALARTHGFRAAHEAVLSDDTTPDVPLRTSDAYLESLVRRDALAQHVTVEARADALLHTAFQSPGTFEPETRLLDRVAQTAGSFSPRSFAELAELSKQLPEIDRQLTSVSRAWQDALADANGSNVTRFLTSHVDWTARLSAPELAKSGPVAGTPEAKRFFSELRDFTAKDPVVEARLTALHTRGDGAEAASYRMQVRLAIVLRMRSVLMSIAGRTLLAANGGAPRAAYDRLLACEDLKLPALGAEPPPPAEAVTPYPPFEEDVRLTQQSLPGFMGIRFSEPTEQIRKRFQLPDGASLVSLVYPDSAASAAGLEPGDVVLGAPGAPFTSRNQVRAWTMLSEIGKPNPLDILRNGAKRRVSIVPKPYPLEFPSLPSAIQVGQLAPPIPMTAYRGAVVSSLKPTKKHVLFFWATWCGPCKASVPELLAFEKESHVPVVAVTDEGRPTLDAFFKKFAAPFPEAVASDELRRAFLAYGVSGTPTFVLVDEHGKVTAQQVGYDMVHGLPFPGWKWKH